MVKFYRIIFLFCVFLSHKDLFGHDISCDSRSLEVISKINLEFFQNKKRNFIQTRSNNGIVKNKSGYIEYSHNNFIKISYPKNKSFIIYDSENNITYINQKLNSVKKYQNDQELFRLILKSRFESILNQNLIYCKSLNLSYESGFIELIIKNKKNNSEKILINFKKNMINSIKTIISDKNFILINFTK